MNDLTKNQQAKRREIERQQISELANLLRYGSSHYGSSDEPPADQELNTDSINNRIVGVKEAQEAKAKSNTSLIAIIAVALFFLIVFVVFASYNSGSAPSPSPSLSEYDWELYNEWKMEQEADRMYFGWP